MRNSQKLVCRIVLLFFQHQYLAIDQDKTQIMTSFISNQNIWNASNRWCIWLKRVIIIKTSTQDRFKCEAVQSICHYCDEMTINRKWVDIRQFTQAAGDQTASMLKFQYGVSKSFSEEWTVGHCTGESVFHNLELEKEILSV